MTEAQLNSINDFLNENKNVTNFIKDYILKFRFADLACHSISSEQFSQGLSYGTTEEVNDEYVTQANAIIEEYNNNVQRICDKDNIKTYCENDNLKGLKTELDNAKEESFKKIIDLYNGIENFRYTSGYRSDFLLSDMYMEYITSDEFVYDDDNPYVVELVYDIENFLNTRSKLDNTVSDVAAMIVKFNQLCNETISQYWSADKKDYYSHIKGIFQYDFYSNDDTQLIEAKLNDDNRVTLYSKVLEYLKTVTRYTQPSSAAEKYKNMSTDDLIAGKTVENSADETENEIKLKNLKKISLMFGYIKKLESDFDPNFFSEYINTDNLKDAFTLASILDADDLTLSEFNKTSSITPNIANTLKAPKKYTGDLKGLTQTESRILRNLSDRAINWYLNNSKKIDNGKLFEDFMEVKWPSPTVIHKDGKAHNFFFIEEPQTLDEQMSDNRHRETTAGSDLTENYNFTEDSLLTEYGVDSYDYWLRYCTIATLVNCMMPMYWATGLIVSGAPVSLPIIFVPIIAIPSRVTLVIGLGICGICPMPMLYFVNMGDMPGFMIPALNMLVDLLKKIPEAVLQSGNNTIKGILKGLIEANDKKIDDKTQEIEDLNKQITNLKNGIGEDKETLRGLKKKTKKNSTSNTKESET